MKWWEKLFGWILFFNYRYWFLPTALFLIQVLRPLLPKKLREFLKDRKDLVYTQPPSRPIWIHASSGEIEYAKSVIREWKIQHPQETILVTYFSPSAKKLTLGFPGIDFVVPAPFDRIQDIKAFLDFFRPRALMIAKTDLWPEMLFQCRRRNIPTLLFSFSRLGQEKFFTKWTRQFLDKIDCQTELDAEMLTHHFKGEITVSGDTRIDQALWRANHPKPIPEVLKDWADRSSSPIWICGSTWPEDELEILKSLPSWISSGGRLIMAPHDIGESHLSDLERTLSSFGGITRLSQWIENRAINPDRADRILLVDQIGWLAELYLLSDLAFVGGSFKEKVHSVLEPLAAGLPVLVGPKHLNSPEALRFKNVIAIADLNWVSVVSNAAEINEQLEKMNSALGALPAESPLVALSGASRRLVNRLK